MAKENYIFIIGQACVEPNIKKDVDGTPVRASIPLTTLRREKYDRAGNFSPKWDKPVIMTANPALMKQIENIQLYDFVEVKGTITTKNYKRRTICPKCGEEKICDAMMTFISPTYINVRCHATSRTEGLPYLSECAEASNILKLIGRVCRDPEIYTYDDGSKCCSYPIAVNRKFYIDGSVDEEDHSDYPWVKSFGEQADEDIEALHVDSLVYIDGYMRTLRREQQIQCTNPECLEFYTFPNAVMEVVPYSVEYLQGCTLPESTRLPDDDDIEDDEDSDENNDGYYNNEDAAN